MTDQASRKELIDTTQSAFRLLDAWMVPKDLHPRLLGLPADAKKRHINRYRMGTPIPQDGDSYQRIATMFRINDMLRKLFPHSELSACLWVTTPNLHYGSHMPLDSMLDGGLEGMLRVEASLVGATGW